MCGLCAVLNAKDSWTDLFGKSDFSEDQRQIGFQEERDRLIGLLNRILSHHQLTLLDWGGSSYILKNMYGFSRNIYNLMSIFQASDELLEGEKFDPLNEELLIFLSNDQEKNQDA